MNILVCVKQIPDPAEPKAGAEGAAPFILNPFDGYALEAAALLKDADPEITVSALTMAPQEEGEEALRICLSITADKVWRVWDETLEGSDPLAASYVLSEAVKKLEEQEGPFDAIFCGKQAMDEESGQVGPQLAQRLGRPLVTCALEAEIDGAALKVKKEAEGGARIMGAGFPCVVTFTKSARELRYPVIRRRMSANRAQIPALTAAELGLDPDRVGPKGSGTRVKRVFAPPERTRGVTIQEKTAEDSARKLFQLLSDGAVI